MGGFAVALCWRSRKSRRWETAVVPMPMDSGCVMEEYTGLRQGGGEGVGCSTRATWQAVLQSSHFWGPTQPRKAMFHCQGSAFLRQWYIDYWLINSTSLIITHKSGGLLLTWDASLYHGKGHPVITVKIKVNKSELLPVSLYWNEPAICPLTFRWSHLLPYLKELVKYSTIL